VYPDVGGIVFRPFGGGHIKRIRSHSKKGPGFWWNEFSRTSRRGRVDGRWTRGDHLQSRSEQPGTFSARRKVERIPQRGSERSGPVSFVAPALRCGDCCLA